MEKPNSPAGTISSAPVRDGDVFRRAADGAAITVLDKQFGGMKMVRIQGVKRGKSFLHLGDYKVSELKLMERIGRATYMDGTYSTPENLIPSLPTSETELSD